LSIVGSVLILGALSALTLPGFERLERDLSQREHALDLETLNSALARYRADHGGRLPGQNDGEWDRVRVTRQLTLPTDADGNLHPEGRCGPYLEAGVPPNPLNGSAEIRIELGSALPSPDGSTGWTLHVPTAAFVSNAFSD
jgi:type II secretory pathway pseudopilin PulG